MRGVAVITATCSVIRSPHVHPQPAWRSCGSKDQNPRGEKIRRPSCDRMTTKALTGVNDGVSLSLKLPESLHRKLRELAERDNVSINQFIATAVAQKAAALLTVDYSQSRGQ